MGANFDDADVIRVLLDLGADQSLTDDDGLTALELAQALGSDAAAAALS